jgi:hypothetical protein
MCIKACSAALACLLLCSAAAWAQGQQQQKQQQQQCSLAESLAVELRGQLSKDALVLLPFSGAYRCEQQQKHLRMCGSSMNNCLLSSACAYTSMQPLC